jgi:hypothetical protein
MKPAGIFFNSPVEEITGRATKGWFSLPKILLDAAKLDALQQETLRNTFGISNSVLMKDVLQSVVAVAFGKDFIKVKEKAIAFVDYLLASFEHLADRGLPYPTWVHARDALFKGNNAIPKPSSLTGEDVDVFGRTLDFYITNALLFKPPRPGPTNMDLERMDQVNFFLFYLQDMNEREQALAFTLLFAQHAIATVTKPGSTGDPISVAMRHGQIAIVFDELGSLLRRDHPVLQTLASAISLFREAATHRCSLVMATRVPSAVDLDLLETDVLGPSIAGAIETNIYVGKVKEKEGLAHLVSWLGSKGAKVSSAVIEALKPSQALLVQAKATGEPVRFEVLESGMMSVDVTPALLKAMLATPILVSKKPAVVPASGNETRPPTRGATPLKEVTAPPPQQVRHETPVAKGIHPIPEVAPSRPGTGSPLESPVPRTQAGRVESGTPPILADPAPPRVPSPSSKPRALTSPAPVGVPAMIGIEKAVVPFPATKEVNNPVMASRQPPLRKEGVPVVEELLDQYEPGEEDSDEGLGGARSDVQGDMSSDLDFLSRLLGTEQAVTGEGKISRMDYNMALNALLFKLEKVVKAPFGVQFFKELMSSKSMAYERAMEMYYQESNAMLKGKFAVQRGGLIAYQGIKDAVRAIVAELGLQIPPPSDADLEQLEVELLKALDIPRHELLQRIKDGSLYF